MAKKLINKTFWIGFLGGILFTFAGIFVAYKIDSKRTEIIKNIDLESIDTVSDIYKGMTKEDFMNEMQKGCYGDLTQEQIDSLMLDVALFNHGD